MTDAGVVPGLSQNPVDGSWGYACQEHGLTRLGLTGQHALNVERKHLREDHADQTDALELDLKAMAGHVARWAQHHGTPADNTTRAAVLRAWRLLTSLPETEAVELACRLADSERPVRAAVAPF